MSCGIFFGDYEDLVETTIDKLREIVIIRPMLVKLSELLAAGGTETLFLSAGTIVNTS